MENGSGEVNSQEGVVWNELLSARPSAEIQALPASCCSFSNSRQAATPLYANIPGL